MDAMLTNVCTLANMGSMWCTWPEPPQVGRALAERLALGPAYEDSGYVVVDEAGVPPCPET